MRLAVVVALLAVARASAAAPAVLIGVEVQDPSTVRLDLSAPVQPIARKLPASDDLPSRIYLDLPETALGAPPGVVPGTGDVLRVRMGQFDPTTVRVVLDLRQPLRFTVRQSGNVVTVELSAIIATLAPPVEPPTTAPAPEGEPPTAVQSVEAPAAPPPPDAPPPAAAVEGDRARRAVREVPPSAAVEPASPPSEPSAPPPAIAEPVAPPTVADVPSPVAEADAPRVADAPPPPSPAPEPQPPVAQAPAAPAAGDPSPPPAEPPPVIAEVPEPAVDPAPPPPVAAPEPPPVVAEVPAPPAAVDPPPEPAPAAAPEPPPVVAEAPVPPPAVDPPSPPAPAARSPVPPAPLPVVVLDAGHGGRDPGAEGVGGVIEKDVVLELARLLAERLPAQLPVAVTMTRSDDSFVSIDRRLSVPAEGAALFLSLHANACSDPSARGLEIFYGGGSVRQASAAGTNAPAALLGQCIDEALRSRVGPVRGAPRPGSFRVLTQNPVPSALVEIGYLTHPAEAERARDAAYLALLADALVEGVAAFLRASATPPL